MSKTPEQVLEDTWRTWGSGGFEGHAKRIVSALRSAGWLRDYPLSTGHVDLREALVASNARLTRERDEALAAKRCVENALEFAERTRDEAQKREANLREALRATTATPEMLRVVEAAKEFRRMFRPGYILLLNEVPLIAAVDALAASPRKAEPEPRYGVLKVSDLLLSWGVWDRRGCWESTHKTREGAEAHAARLNAEASS